ncbi:serine/threonine-protein kinase HipA [Planctomicrobium piriforme]|uniref:Serine/threonine-protein kinase HipA n=1 Tax=Planctomicrobium piriforme TaxID=1576369 RepID=A0A1I3I8V7_9PLAN|nr:serine/threonine-protein kinase HipA [Planctomicrobium piriforme]
MTACRICLQPTGDDPPYHPACLESLFGSRTLPRLEFSLPSLMRLATDMAGKMSISGMQEKVSLKLSDDKSQLAVAPSDGRYILKPEPSRFAFVPQNEHLTMSLARLVGIEVPPFGLFELTDGAVAYLIKRFDRGDDGAKVLMEDFCQLAGKPLRDKYDGSGELCVRILRQFASEPLIEIRKLFKMLLFSWCVSNGDQHLKNFSLFTQAGGIRRLTPAYDLICTRLPIPGDRSLALTIGGKKSNLSRKLWLDFARYCQIPERAAVRLLSEQVEALEPAVALIHNSLLPDDLKAEYEAILRENTEQLSGRN